MKKRISVIVLCLLMVGFAKAGDGLLDFGLKGGLNFPSLNATDGFDWNSKVGFHAGAMVRVNIPIVNVIGEVLYSQTGFTAPETEDLKNTYLDIPITAQISLLKIITIHAGPQFSFLTSSKVGDVSIKDDIESNAFNFVAGAGVALGSLEVKGRFVFPSGIKLSDTTTEYKNSNIQLSVGYWF